MIDAENAPAEGTSAPVVEVTGEIDMYTSPGLRARLTGMIEGGFRQLVVDLSQVTFIDSAGLGVLVGALREARRAGGDLGLVISSPAVDHLFAITGLRKVFRASATVVEAQAGMAGGVAATGEGVGSVPFANR